jgi:Ca2+-binding RTX toxin-like protein
VIAPGPGNDTVEGGAGRDTVEIGGGRGESDVRPGENGVVVDGPDGTDTLTGIERIEFGDGVELFDQDGPFAEFVYRLYSAAYARTPDEEGFVFWNDYMNDVGNTPTGLASFFIDAPEFDRRYGENPTDEDFIDALYNNVLLRDADEDGFEFWLNAFQSGETREDMLVFFAESPENVERNLEFLDFGIFVS